jgi:hypothetical protein
MLIPMPRQSNSERSKITSGFVATPWTFVGMKWGLTLQKVMKACRSAAVHCTGLDSSPLCDWRAVRTASSHRSSCVVLLHRGALALGPMHRNVTGPQIEVWMIAKGPSDVELAVQQQLRLNAELPVISEHTGEGVSALPKLEEPHLWRRLERLLAHRFAFLLGSEGMASPSHLYDGRY